MSCRASTRKRASAAGNSRTQANPGADLPYQPGLVTQPLGCALAADDPVWARLWARAKRGSGQPAITRPLQGGPDKQDGLSPDRGEIAS